MPKFTPETARQDAGSDHACGPYLAILFSDSGGLTQFGAFVEILPPRSSSSIFHWYAGEDEMVYMLEGAVVVDEGEESYVLNPGEAVTFKAGVARGHCLRNDSDREARYLVIGTRSGGDVVTYPRHDRVLTFSRADGEVNQRVHTTLNGELATSPYEDGN